MTFDRQTLRLRVLGGLSLLSEGPHSLGRRPLALFALLAVAGERGLSRDKIVALLWPESDDERARNSLSQLLSTIRREFHGSDPVLGTTELRLDENEIISDLSSFERRFAGGDLEGAVASYGGPFLDGFFIKDAAGFEQWVERHRARLQDQYVTCLTRLAKAAEATGAVGDAARWWRQLAALDPGHTAAIAGLMQALAALGDRSGALTHYRVHQAYLRREFNVHPDQAVVAFATQLTQGEALVRHEPAGLTRADYGIADLPAGQPVADSKPSGSVHVRFRTRGVKVILGSLLFVVLAMAAKVNSSRVSLAQSRLVAIGVLENRTNDSSVSAFADVAATNIAQLLSESRSATVIDLRDSLTNPERSDPGARTRIARLARRRRAAHLVQGGFERRRDDLVAVMQVLDAQSGRIVYQLDPIVVPSAAPESGLVLLRESVGGAIMALNDTVYHASWGHSRPPRYSSFHEFRQGIDALVQQDGRVAIPHLLKSMTLDPDFVQPKLLYLKQAIWNAAETPRIDSVRAALVAQRPRMGAYDQAATDEKLAFLDGRLEDTFTAARQMVALAPRSPDALAMLAQASMATRRYRRALEALHTLRQSPGWLKEMRSERIWDLQAHRLLGDYETGIAEWEGWLVAMPDDDTVCRQGFAMLAAAGRAAQVDSLLVSCVGKPAQTTLVAAMLLDAGRNFRMAGYHREAGRAFTRLLALRIELAARDSNLRYDVGVAHMELKHWHEAYEAMRHLTLTDGLDGAADVGRVPRRPRGQRVTFAIVASNVGDTTIAVETLRWLEGGDRRSGADMDRGLILAALGRKDEAITALQEAMRVGIAPAWSGWYVRGEFDPLRNDPRFQALIRPISCTPAGC